MRHRRLAVLAALLAAPTLSLANDRFEGDEWDDGRSSGGYDVSVDLNDQGAVSLESFQAPLQPYGDWVDVGNYGRVWRPRVAAGWRPYYYGRWEWTNEGWFWVSDEPWGWAAYHYGRWAYDPYYGWLWVPGYEWAPAWVSWRVSGEAVGWAPLAPGFSVYVSSYPFIDFWWTFVPCVRFASVPVYSIAYAPTHARRWFDATAPAPARPTRRGFASAPSPAWGGPAPRLIESRMGRPVTPSRIVRAPSPGERGRPGEIPVYRPGRPGRVDPFPAVADRGGRTDGRGPLRQETAEALERSPPRAGRDDATSTAAAGPSRAAPRRRRSRVRTAGSRRAEPRNLSRGARPLPPSRHSPRSAAAATGRRAARRRSLPRRPAGRRRRGGGAAAAVAVVAAATGTAAARSRRQGSARGPTPAPPCSPGP